jgi:hypothetical protein
MGTVIGPISEEDWQIMRMLRTQIRYMQKDPTRYGDMLEEGKNKYNNKYLAKYAA